MSSGLGKKIIACFQNNWVYRRCATHLSWSWSRLNQPLTKVWTEKQKSAFWFSFLFPFFSLNAKVIFHECKPSKMKCRKTNAGPIDPHGNDKAMNSATGCSQWGQHSKQWGAAGVLWETGKIGPLAGDVKWRNAEMRQIPPSPQNTQF